MKYRLWTALTALAILAGATSPAAGKDAEKRPERKERTVRETPYSNAAVAREREARKIEREIEKDRQPNYYVFEHERRRPQN